MTRKEEIKEKAHFEAAKFSVRYGYANLEEELYKMAVWADNNPAWVSVEEGLPPKTSDNSFVSIMVAVKCAGNPDRWYPAEYWYDTKQWFCCEIGTSSDYLDDVTHWKEIF